MKTAKLGAIFLASVIALGMTGAGYALWSDNLYVFGDVDTGCIGAQFTYAYGYDNEQPNKDVSWVYATIWSDYKTNDELAIFVNNAYPCIDYCVDFAITNTGTIPIHASGIQWTGGTLPPGEVTITWPGQADYVQIHPGETVYGTITIHLNNDAYQNSEYEFYGSLMYWQYNEVPE